jgi:hypothetical protein
MSHILASVLLGLLVAATMNPPLASKYGSGFRFGSLGFKA